MSSSQVPFLFFLLSRAYKAGWGVGENLYLRIRLRPMEIERFLVQLPNAPGFCRESHDGVVVALPTFMLFLEDSDALHLCVQRVARCFDHFCKAFSGGRVWGFVGRVVAVGPGDENASWPILLSHLDNKK